MGSPDFAIPALDALHNHHEIVAVYSQPPRKSGRGMGEKLVPVAQHAESLNLPTHWPESLTDKACRDVLAGFDADLFIVVAYGLLLPQSVLDLPHFGCINGHASLLPRWRGAAPIQRAIEAGDNETGISAMVMEAGLDTGPVLATQHVNITANETAGTLHDKLAVVNAEILLRTVNEVPAILSTQQIQNDDDAIYAAKISSAEAQIDWRKPAHKIDQHIRAFSPFPGAWFNGEKGRIKISEAIVDTNDSNSESGGATPGTYIGRSDEGGMRVATGAGVLTLVRLQPAGKKPMPVADFLNGQAMSIGTVLTGLDDGAT